MAERLDEEKLAQIRAWAEAMLTHERAESRASARGLLLLADEVERLWEANRTAFANDIGAALAERLGTDPSTAAADAELPTFEVTSSPNRTPAQSQGIYRRLRRRPPEGG